MFAVLKTGGKQYKVYKNDVIVVEKLTAQAGDLVQFENIMMVGGDKVEIGTPTITGAAVQAEVVEQAQGKKVISFVKRRRKHSSQRTRGHRQQVTVVRIQNISVSGLNVARHQIEDGVSIVGSDKKLAKKNLSDDDADKKPGKILEGSATGGSKTNTGKKSIVNTESSTNVASKSETAKRSVAKAKTVNKTVAKTKTANKAVGSKKSVSKNEAVKKPIQTKKS
tara:strand:- start:7 stop:675 length:669 start_codon:yes stop_codon:yes gene_type:complete